MADSAATGDAGLKLNLGSGQNLKAGYINVDKSGTPDVTWDLEVFPWPWPDSSISEVLMIHVLEHLGDRIETFFGVIKELYRVCRHDARVFIRVPHPRHDDFLGDPTHLRPFIPDSFALYDKILNRKWASTGVSNTPLGLYLDVDFVIAEMTLDLDQPWADQLASGKITQEQAMGAIRQFNNVVKQIRVTWRVNKPETTAPDQPQ